MTIPSAAKHKPLDLPQPSFPAVDPRTGLYSASELQRQANARNYVVGMGRIIPCSCVSASNVLTLTPNGNAGQDGESPVLEDDYKFGDVFLFVADASATGSVTAKVITKAGNALATIKVYITGGAAQAGNGDITAGRVYMGVYAYNLDANAGGIVIRHP